MASSLHSNSFPVSENTSQPVADNVIPRFLSRPEWEAKLRRWGCRPLEGKGRLNTAEWWIGANGAPFTVPVEGDDDRCDFWAMWRLCQVFGRNPSELDDGQPN